MDSAWWCSRAAQAVVVPCHSVGDDVAARVFSYAVCRYRTGFGSAKDSAEILTELSLSASKAQK